MGAQTHHGSVEAGLEHVPLDRVQELHVFQPYVYCDSGCWLLPLRYLLKCVEIISHLLCVFERERHLQSEDELKRTGTLL